MTVMQLLISLTKFWIRQTLMPICMKELLNDVQRPNDLFFSSKWKFFHFFNRWHHYFRFLQEVGYEDIFNPNEINEIKELYNRA